MKSFRSAVRLDPELPLAQQYLGTLLMEVGALEDARVHLREAIRLNPKEPFAHFSLGTLFCRERNCREGVVHLENALAQDPNFIPALTSLALVRASNVDDTLRNGRQAVQLATKACALSQNRRPEALHALAAAYAETGRFADAISTVNLAVQAARAVGNKIVADIIQQTLQLYKAQKPFRSDRL